MNASDEYTPTTEQVRDGYVLRGWADEPEIAGEKGWEAQDRLGAGFDRWLAEHDKQVAVEALREAAADIPEQMRMDELALHQLSYVNQLPDLPKVMLNGATRFAERLLARAATLDGEATP